mmetsp:Transcript_32481/g.85252  ORF Transcript_32481/g.85252 Transcript_32481/m.85252 type:complete len:263 (+) Transcript_32481:714-1502(+)
MHARHIRRQALDCCDHLLSTRVQIALREVQVVSNELLPDVAAPLDQDLVRTMGERNHRLLVHNTHLVEGSRHLVCSKAFLVVHHHGREHNVHERTARSTNHEQGGRLVVKVEQRIDELVETSQAHTSLDKRPERGMLGAHPSLAIGERRPASQHHSARHCEPYLLSKIIPERRDPLERVTRRMHCDLRRDEEAKRIGSTWPDASRRWVSGQTLHGHVFVLREGAWVRCRLHALDPFGELVVAALTLQLRHNQIPARGIPFEP